MEQSRNHLDIGHGEEDLATVLQRLGWLEPGESVQEIQRAGEGNMNLTLRVSTNQRSFIVKHARPWVEKFPQIPAPAERALRERDFYHRIADIPAVSGAMPQLLAADSNAFLLMIEDLGAAADCMSIYAGAPISQVDMQRLGGLIAALHKHTHNTGDAGMANLAMRRLNHEHIFDLPWQQGAVAALGVDLEALAPGLCDAAAELQKTSSLRERVEALGHTYLSEGPCLLHGDFYPGSLLNTESGLYLIDPEFCHFGQPAFDVGVWIAHLAMAQRPIQEARWFLDAYRRAWAEAAIDEGFIAGFAATEVIRRLIGVAQLPLEALGADRPALLLRAARVLEGRDWAPLFVSR